jgi:HlyD family type I secretion membrane fusion protein
MSDLSYEAELDRQVQALSAPKSEGRKGLYIAGAFFIGLLGWAAMTPLDSGAVAQGVVAVSGSRQVVQHREGGIVTAIHVTEGQSVNAGDVLMQVSAPEVVAQERSMSGELVTLWAQRARLNAELGGARSVAVPSEFAKLSGNDRQLADDALRGQRQLFSARNDASMSERDVLNQRVLQQGAQISAYGHQIQANREQQRLISEELGGMKELEERGFVAKNRIRAMERGASELDGNYGALNADILRAKESIGESRMQMVSMRSNKVESVATELRDIQLRLDELEPKLAAIREQISRSLIKAPTAGKVVGMKVHTIGGIVGAGDTVMELVPQNKALVIDARVSPNDADDLKAGMLTQVRFSSLQERRIPVLNGKISKVSADSFEDERTGMRYFKIEAIVPNSELEKIKKVRGDIGITAGLPADVLVPLRKRTALGYLLDPLLETLWLSGREH